MKTLIYMNILSIFKIVLKVLNIYYGLSSYPPVAPSIGLFSLPKAKKITP